MKTLLKRLRASLVVGAAWGLSWFGAGAAMWLAGARADVPFPLGFGVLGFFTGTAFSGVLMIAEGGGRRRLTFPRFAGWGGLGGLSFAAIFGGSVYLVEGILDPLLVTSVVFPVAGAICASGTLWLARQGERRGLIDPGAHLDATGVISEKGRELLGR